MVCSTHVEMFPTSAANANSAERLLHACGDVSLMVMSSSEFGRFAPRMWRCFLLRPLRLRLTYVCSTHVEMFPQEERSEHSYERLLHACGDVSLQKLSIKHRRWFAPRMWRCFSRMKPRTTLSSVCSTHVEMFHLPQCEKELYACLLHACGDVSEI